MNAMISLGYLARSRARDHADDKPAQDVGRRGRELSSKMNNVQERIPTRSPGEGRSAKTSRRNRNSAAGRPPVAVEHLLLVPGRAADAEAQSQAFAPAERAAELAMRRRFPIGKKRKDRLEDRGTPRAPILPGKEAVPGPEARAGLPDRRGGLAAA